MINPFQYQMVVDSLEPDQWRGLSNEQRKDIMDRVFYEDAFRDWFYQTPRNNCHIPCDKDHINPLFNLLAKPQPMQTLIKYIEGSNREEFDRTSCCIAWIVAEKAVDAANRANQLTDEQYQRGEIDRETARSYRGRSEAFGKIIEDLITQIRKKVEYSVSEMSKKTNLPEALIYSTYFIVPGRDYVPKGKIGHYVKKLLEEIYQWTGNNGLDDARIIHWGPFFGNYFGNSLTSSAAVSILLEGVSRIETYQSLDHFDDVSTVWDSLTDFALKELNRASDEVRTQMIELYMKRLEGISRNNNGQSPQLRVDLLRVPRDLTNLAATVQRFGQRLKELTNSDVALPSDTNQNAVMTNTRQNRDGDRNRRERHNSAFETAGLTGDPRFDSEIQRARRIDGKRMYVDGGTINSEMKTDYETDSSWVEDSSLYPPDEEEDDMPKPLFGAFGSV